MSRFEKLSHLLWHCQYYNVTDRDADVILKIAYDQTDSISAGFREDGYGYVFEAIWFTRIPDGSVT